MREMFLFFTGLLLLTTASATSFDCVKAKSKVEHIICDNPEISKLDEQLAAAYKAALHNKAYADVIRVAQKRWIEVRNACPDAECVTGTYESRLSELVNMDEAGAKPLAKTPKLVIGNCVPVSDSDKRYSLVVTVSDAMVHFRNYEHQAVSYDDATVTILQRPRNGILRLAVDEDRGTYIGKTADPITPDQKDYAYLPPKGYYGEDKAALLVDFGGGRTVEMVYFFHMQKDGGSTADNPWENKVCDRTGYSWKISPISESDK